MAYLKQQRALRYPTQGLRGMPSPSGGSFYVAVAAGLLAVYFLNRRK